VSIEDFIITTFCLIDDELQHATNRETLRGGGFEPKLFNSEMITMEIIAEFLGIDTDKGTWEYFRDTIHLADGLPIPVCKVSLNNDTIHAPWESSHVASIY
jgi:hypothetical protein